MVAATEPLLFARLGLPRGALESRALVTECVSYQDVTRRPPATPGILEGGAMKAKTCIRYLDVLGMGIGSSKRVWTAEERRAYYGLLRHFRSMARDDAACDRRRRPTN